MEDIETPTPPQPESPPSLDEGTPVSQDGGKPVSEPAPLGEAEPPEEPTPPAWAGVQEAEELFDLEDVKPIIERREQIAGDRAYERVKEVMQPSVQANTQTLAQISTAVESVMTTLNRAAEDGALDKRTVEDLMRTHRAEFAALNQQYQSVGYWDGVKQYITTLLGADAPTFTSRLEKMQQNMPDPTFAADMQKKLRAQGYEEGHGDGFKKGMKEGKNANSAQTAIKANKGAGANLAPGTPAGGRSDSERLLDPTTPYDEFVEIRNRQKAAGE